MPLRAATPLSREDFDREVYAVVRQIPPGRVLCYGQVAYLVGRPGYARRVGRAMAEAPPDPGLPCHRVVRSDGSLSPGWIAQRSLLEAEGVTFRRSGRIDLDRSIWRLPDEP